MPMILVSMVPDYSADTYSLWEGSSNYVCTKWKCPESSQKSVYMSSAGDRSPKNK